MTQKQVFEQVWDNQGGICYITGKFIPKEKAKPINFMHILSKGAYPKFKYRLDNVLLVDDYVHTLFDFGTRSDLEMKYGEAKINKLYELKEKLKREYNSIR